MADDISSPSSPSLKSRLVDIRRQIHARPELAFQEHLTSDLVAETLASAGIEVHRGLAGTGVVGTLKNGDGPSIGLRADMDALPITEADDPGYKSTHDGVMHACGHDGHTAMLLGAAFSLAESKDFEGTVHFIFQPAEENEGGGRQMVEDGLFRLFSCDAIFALHNWPGLAAGRIAVQPGPMMASYDTFELNISGKGGHAAMPEDTVDPMPISAELILALQTLVSRKVSPHEAAVVSVTSIHGGDAFNIIPEAISLRGCVRTYNQSVRDQLRDEIHRLTAQITAAHGGKAVVDYHTRYPSTINTPEEAGFAAQTAAELVGDTHVDTAFRPSMASEDFAVMLEHVPGAYIWLGNGETSAPLHNPHYDFNDDVLMTGVGLLSALARNFCKNMVSAS
ncbi:MAG: peptidase M20 [Ponticaulis sp.]|nr:peptidase M20 [Ponticaulis sp.]